MDSNQIDSTLDVILEYAKQSFVKNDGIYTRRQKFSTCFSYKPVFPPYKWAVCGRRLGAHQNANWMTTTH